MTIKRTTLIPAPKPCSAGPRRRWPAAASPQACATPRAARATWWPQCLSCGCPPRWRRAPKRSAPPPAPAAAPTKQRRSTCPCSWRLTRRCRWTAASRATSRAGCRWWTPPAGHRRCVTQLKPSAARCFPPGSACTCTRAAPAQHARAGTAASRRVALLGRAGAVRSRRAFTNPRLGRGSVVL